MPEVHDTAEPLDLSIMLPAYNEEGAIGGLIQEIRGAMASWPGRWEIVVVDDASTDATARIAEGAGVRVIRHPERRGAGGACKTGILEARGRVVAMMDADGGHDPAALPALVSFIPPYDQVNGARVGETGTAPALRGPAKWAIRKLAEWLSDRTIPDLNTGMKVFRRDLMLRYLWVIPEGFSNTSSMTLAFLTNGHAVKFVPVPYRKRIGRSKFRPLRDTVQYLKTVLRLCMYFRPLRIFAPVAGLVGVAAVASACHHMFRSPLGLHDADVILAVGALQILIVGLLADLIVAQRRTQG